ncbi:MAG TPA: tRNA pseudouridine(54/55) synthase Pus10 [archaeon]|nr:tRNA pseudouridine(54/55) synthase Pus10 [archaeon]
MKTPFPDNSFEFVAKAISEIISPIEFDFFEIGVSSLNPESKIDLRKQLVEFIEKNFSAKNARDNYDIYLLIQLDRGFIETSISSVFIEGFYNKFSREIAQTFYYCYKCKGRGCDFCSQTGKLSDDSVQELLEKEFFPVFDSKESKFHGAGREDVDVRMLGEGRPFVFELVEPKKRRADLKKLEEKTNKAFKEKISVRDLKFSSKERVVFLKNSPFEKVYLAKCVCESKITAKDLSKIPKKQFDIAQLTPERVQKRRVEKERAKYGRVLEKTFVDGNTFAIKVLASHGLYVKEFISGDNKRTTPSVSSFLGKDCKCVELDVVEIVFEK